MPRFGVMITNGGAHDPGEMAKETARQVLDGVMIEDTSPVYGAVMAEKVRIEKKLAGDLIKAHEDMQSIERAHIEQKGSARLVDEPREVTTMVDEAHKVVDAAMAGSMFEAHYNQPERRDFVRKTLGRHLATIVFIERSIHADKNADDDHAKTFRQMHHPGPAPTT